MQPYGLDESNLVGGRNKMAARGAFTAVVAALLIRAPYLSWLLGLGLVARREGAQRAVVVARTTDEEGGSAAAAVVARSLSRQPHLDGRRTGARTGRVSSLFFAFTWL